METPGQTLRLLESLLSSESPLDGLVRMVSAHTGLPLVRGAAVEDLSEPSSDEAEAKAAQDDPSPGFLGPLGSLSPLGQPPQPPSAQSSIPRWPGTDIRQAFAAYHALLNGKTGSLPGLTEIHAELGDLHSAIAVVANKSEPEAAAFETVRQWMDNPNGTEVGGLRSVAALATGAAAPDAVRAFGPVLVYAHEPRRGSILKNAGSVPCWRNARRAISGRYPIDRQSETLIAPDDFTLFFAHDGVLNTFFAQHLSPFVVTSGGQWQERSIYDQQVGFSAEAAWPPFVTPTPFVRRSTSTAQG